MYVTKSHNRNIYNKKLTYYRLLLKIKGSPIRKSVSPEVLTRTPRKLVDNCESESQHTVYEYMFVGFVSK